MSLLYAKPGQRVSAHGDKRQRLCIPAPQTRLSKCRSRPVGSHHIACSTPKRDFSTHAQVAGGPAHLPSWLPVQAQEPPVRDVATARPRVVVLGTGWASMSFIKALPPNVRKEYDIVVVSPRNYFLYTPLLPAVAVGTMEEHSVVEPVRNLLQGKATYYEAVCKQIDPVKREIICSFKSEDGSTAGDSFKLPYDLLVMGVGSETNTFGIKGVQEHCMFFKTIEDANKLRRRISECFERAALPNMSNEERQKLLSFVICGGGPTGIEVAAEIHDLVFEDLKEHYPDLMKYVRVRVIELMDHVLSTYDRKIGDFTAQQFKRTGLELVLNSRVASVRPGYVKVVHKEVGEEEEIPFGACVWATGIAMNPLVKQLQQLFPNEQKHFRSVLTDEYMRVLGSNGTIWAFGDASTIYQPRALEHADALFDAADTNKNGLLSLRELQLLIKEASKTYPHLAEHARFLEARNHRFSNLVIDVLNNINAEKIEDGTVSKKAYLEWHDELTKEEFKAVLEKIDSGLRALPATAQVAAQEGGYLAKLLMNAKWDDKAAELQLAPRASPFKYFHKGSLAYVGEDKAVMDAPILGPLFGRETGMLWRSYEIYAQFTLQKKLRVFNDWARSKIFGRDISRI